MLFFVHDLRWVCEVDCLDHHAGYRALLNSKQFEQVLLVDLSDELANLDVAVEVLAAATTRQVDEVVAMETTLFVKTVVDRDDVLLLE